MATTEWFPGHLGQRRFAETKIVQASENPEVSLRSKWQSADRTAPAKRSFYRILQRALALIALPAVCMAVGCQSGLHRGNAITLSPPPIRPTKTSERVAATPSATPAVEAQIDLEPRPVNSSRLASTQSGSNQSGSNQSASARKIRLTAYQENGDNKLSLDSVLLDDATEPLSRINFDDVTDADAETAKSALADADLTDDESTDTDLSDMESTDADEIDGDDSSSLERDELTADPDTKRGANDRAVKTRRVGLTLDEVLQSVTEYYPEIEIAIGELDSASGKIVAARGAFDSIISGHSISQPLGFYQTYQNGIGLTRPLYGGGEVYSTYRIGDGNFEPWFGERETNEGGELKAGFSLPLLKDRDIDLRRANLRFAETGRQQVEANVETRLLMFERMAAQAYWDWVASGQVVEIQRQLLSLAEERVEQIRLRIEEEDLEVLAEIDNDRFIAKRKNSLIKARRGVQKAAIKLSLYYRSANGCPIVPNENQLPNFFPDSGRITNEQLCAGVDIALRSRPELVELLAARQETLVALRYAQNLLLPKLDLKGFAGQDVGGETSSLGDKTPFEFQAGLFAEVPLQRREGQGKIQAAQGKLTQIDAKRQIVSDKIRAEIQDAASAVNASWEQIEQSRENVRLNERSLELGELLFREGDIDLLALNIYESSVADARLLLLEAQYKYFYSLAAWRTVTRGTAFTTVEQRAPDFQISADQVPMGQLPAGQLPMGQLPVGQGPVNQPPPLPMEDLGF